MRIGAAALLLAALAGGCAKVPPPLTEAGGVVLLDGQPLPNARVEFVPELADFGAEMNSAGVTDDKGRFQLTCSEKQQPGAVVGKHRVVVMEAPVPAEFRNSGQKAQAAHAEYLARQKNRPIPADYGNASKTPLRVEVTRGQRDYTLKLTRKS
jgi:hypothetical protein